MTSRRCPRTRCRGSPDWMKSGILTLSPALSRSPCALAGLGRARSCGSSPRSGSPRAAASVSSALIVTSVHVPAERGLADDLERHPAVARAAGCRSSVHADRVPRDVREAARPDGSASCRRAAQPVPSGSACRTTAAMRRSRSGRSRERTAGAHAATRNVRRRFTCMGGSLPSVPSRPCGARPAFGRCISGSSGCCQPPGAAFYARSGSVRAWRRGFSRRRPGSRGAPSRRSP